MTTDCEMDSTERLGLVRRRVASAGSVVAILMTAGPLGAASLKYNGSWTNPSGVQEPVSFEGTATSGTINGTLRLGTYVLTAKGLISTDRSVSGTLVDEAGVKRATFAARPDSAGILRGTVDAGGRQQTWSAPGLALPAATDP
jgi:hypothetical protein